MKVVSLSALSTGRLYSSGNIPNTHFFQWLSWSQGQNVAGRIMPMKNLNDPTGNRTRDLPACNPVPKLSAPPLTPKTIVVLWLNQFLQQQWLNEECDKRSENQNYLRKQISINSTSRIEGLRILLTVTVRIIHNFKYSFSLSIIACLMLKLYGSSKAWEC